MTDVMVGNSGICVFLKKHDEISKVFSRLHLQSSYEGYGLGLAISRRIAANHSSETTLVSSRGEGAEFTVKLAFA